jgi:hypothetical protein
LQAKSVFGDVKAWVSAYARAFMLRASFYGPKEVVFPSTDFDRNWVSLPVPLCVSSRVPSQAEYYEANGDKTSTCYLTIISDQYYQGSELYSKDLQAEVLVRTEEVSVT